MAMVLALILLSAPFGQAWGVYHADDVSVDLFVEMEVRPVVVVAYVSGVDGVVESVALIETGPGVYGGNWELPRTENYRVQFGALFADGVEEVSADVSLADLGVPADVFVSDPTPAVTTPVAETGNGRPWGWVVLAVVAGLGSLVALRFARRRGVD
ncbi:MAG: hypothetical protein HKN93_08090 [Acidimicrobiia bacterium]|nr:hypothetical protein [Acidimicrobiia bacterium]